MPSPRERMVISAALLIRERGAQPTAIADVLEHSGAPRGSAYHYFPGGRTQLLCEAIDYVRRVCRGQDRQGRAAVSTPSTTLSRTTASNCFAPTTARVVRSSP